MGQCPCIASESPATIYKRRYLRLLQLRKWGVLCYDDESAEQKGVMRMECQADVYNV